MIYPRDCYIEGIFGIGIKIEKPPRITSFLDGAVIHRDEKRE